MAIPNAKTSESGSRKFSARKLFVTESPSLRSERSEQGERVKRLRALRGDSKTLRGTFGAKRTKVSARCTETVSFESIFCVGIRKPFAELYEQSEVKYPKGVQIL